jgi:hypothetical protein
MGKGRSRRRRPARPSGPFRGDDRPGEAGRALPGLLGDLVDRGPDNAATAADAAAAAQGQGLFIRGNHDDKLFRTLKGNPTIVDSDLAVTLEQLDAAADGKLLKKRFAEAYRAAPFSSPSAEPCSCTAAWHRPC